MPPTTPTPNDTTITKKYHTISMCPPPPTPTTTTVQTLYRPYTNRYLRKV